jgi:hypothetical protein
MSDRINREAGKLLQGIFELVAIVAIVALAFGYAASYLWENS